MQYVWNLEDSFSISVAFDISFVTFDLNVLLIVDGRQKREK